MLHLRFQWHLYSQTWLGLISCPVRVLVWSSSGVYMYQTPAEACQPPPWGPLFRGVIGRAAHGDALGSQQFITPSKPISDTWKCAETRDGCVRRDHTVRWTASPQREVMAVYWLLSAETRISCLKQHWSSLGRGGSTERQTLSYHFQGHTSAQRKRGNTRREEQMRTRTDRSFTP